MASQADESRARDGALDTTASESGQALVKDMDHPPLFDDAHPSIGMAGMGPLESPVRDKRTVAGVPPRLRSKRPANDTAPGKVVETHDNEELAGLILSDRFKLLTAIGRGPLGTVYEAEDMELDCFVAVKVIDRRITANAHLMDRVRNQVAKARGVVHPNVCRTYDVARHEDLHYLVMEFVPGQTLAEEMRLGLGADTVRNRFLQILDALQAIHAAGVVHGAVHASHIRVRADGLVQVMGAGLSCDILRGTDIEPRDHICSSPEQAAGKRATVRSDIYSIGVIAQDLIDACRTGERLPRLLPIAERCVRPNPAERFASVPAILETFEQLAAESENEISSQPVAAAAPLADPDVDIEVRELPLATFGLALLTLVRMVHRVWSARIPLPLVLLLFGAYALQQSAEDVFRLEASNLAEDSSSDESFFSFFASDGETTPRKVKRIPLQPRTKQRARRAPKTIRNSEFQVEGSAELPLGEDLYDDDQYDTDSYNDSRKAKRPAVGKGTPKPSRTVPSHGAYGVSDSWAQPAPVSPIGSGELGFQPGAY